MFYAWYRFADVKNSGAVFGFVVRSALRTFLSGRKVLNNLQRTLSAENCRFRGMREKRFVNKQGSVGFVEPRWEVWDGSASNVSVSSLSIPTLRVGRADRSPGGYVLQSSPHASKFCGESKVHTAA